MTTDTENYRRDLVVALRMGNVPPDRIGEIVAEVESHVAETGESPVEAFGPPKEYAAGFAEPRGARDRVTLVLLTLVAAACGWLIASGMFGLVHGEDALGMPAWAAVALGAVLWIPPVHSRVRLHARVLDPRTGRPLVPPPGAVVLGMIGFLLLLGLLAWLMALLTV